MSRLIIGLTGGIGSGKTTIADLFTRHHGIVAVDADVYARTVVEPGTAALTQIATHFGEQILLPDGTLDRPALRSRIFQHPEERKWLESLLHPLIFHEMQTQLAHAASPYALLVSPLLVEAGQSALCHRVLVIDAPETAQLERTMQRDNNSAEQVKAIMHSQASREQRLAQADYVLLNDGDLITATSRVAALHQQFLQLL